MGFTRSLLRQLVLSLYTDSLSLPPFPQNVCSISVNAGYDRFRKFNLLETAEAGRKDEEGGRVAAAQEAKDEEKVEKEA